MKSIQAFFIVAALAILVPLFGSAAAQEKRQHFAVPAAPAYSAAQQQSLSAGGPGMFERARIWLMAQQSKFHRELSAAVKNLKTGEPARAILVLTGIAFLYGVLHAAGPGHGKAVISSYVLANEETVRRGISLSFLAALIQALSAIFFVGIFAILFNQTKPVMDQAENTIESLSWGLVAALGSWMLYRQFKATWPSVKLVEAGPAHHRDHAHHIHEQHDHGHHDHGHHDHGANCNCGHSHMPAPQDLQGAWSWRKAFPIALSVGIRPCTGAIILLIFAMSQGLLWAGILGTFAMALGTAITVSILAALTVYSRDFAERMSGDGSLWAQRIHTAAGFAGAALVFLLGSAFFMASLKGPSPL